MFSDTKLASTAKHDEVELSWTCFAQSNFSRLFSSVRDNTFAGQESRSAFAVFWLIRSSNLTNRMSPAGCR